MNIFELKLFDDEGQKCSLYTVQWQDARWSETEKFLNKFRNDATLARPLQELVTFLYLIITEEQGAQKQFFRYENQAQALPPRGVYEINELTINYAYFPLRLYCLRISDSLVILFNGGEKTSDSAQDGATSMPFREANQFATRILEAIRNGEILVTASGRSFLDAYGNTYIEL